MFDRFLTKAVYPMKVKFIGCKTHYVKRKHARASNIVSYNNNVDE